MKHGSNFPLCLQRGWQVTSGTRIAVSMSVGVGKLVVNIVYVAVLGIIVVTGLAMLTPR